MCLYMKGVSSTKKYGYDGGKYGSGRLCTGYLSHLLDNWRYYRCVYYVLGGDANDRSRVD